VPRILVIDDQADVRAMISIVLRIHRFDIVEAASAAEGLKAFQEAHFDLAIVDVFLQCTSGVDVTAIIQLPDLPVIAISGMTPLDFVSRTPELSNVVCLQKPFRPNDLMHAIEAARDAVRPSVTGVA
jgi:DNA-binding response OmpR family regulator